MLNLLVHHVTSRL